MANQHMERCSTLKTIKEIKLRPQQDTTSHPPRQKQYQTLIPTGIGKGVKTAVMGMQNEAVTFKGSLAGPQRFKNKFHVRHHNPTPRYLRKIK